MIARRSDSGWCPQQLIFVNEKTVLTFVDAGAKRPQKSRRSGDPIRLLDTQFFRALHLETYTAQSGERAKGRNFVDAVRHVAGADLGGA